MMRVVVIGNVLVPLQMEVWRKVSKYVDLHYIGSLQGYGNTVWTSAPPSLIDDFQIYPLKPRGILSRGHLWWVYPQLSNVLDRVRPDVVHVTSAPWGLLAIQAILQGRRDGLAVVIHSSDSQYDLGANWETRIRYLVTHRVLPRVSGFVGVTTESVRVAHAHGLGSEVPTTLAQHLISDPERYQGVYPRVRTNGVTKIGFVGRLVPEKGVDTLIDAASRIKEESIEIIVAGDGPERQRLEKRARDSGLNVTFVGKVPFEELPGIYHRMDILVVPSRSSPSSVERFGRVAVEGMFSGLPVISSDSGELPEVLGEAATIFPEGDSEALAAALKKVVRDPKLRKSLGDQARIYAIARHGPEQQAKRLALFWDEVRRYH